MTDDDSTPTQRSERDSFDDLVDRLNLHLRNVALPPNREPPPIGFDSSASDSADADGFPRIPGYTILGPTGSGSFGIVYRARSIKLGRVVAIKVLKHTIEQTAHDAARFQRDGEFLAGFNHENIVTVYETGELNGHAYIVMEFLEGGTLKDKMVTTSISIKDAVVIVNTLARTMAYCHANVANSRLGVIHRDLKPANILLAPKPELASRFAQANASERAALPPSDFNVKITDFGLAKCLGRDGLTLTGQQIGTPAYMSPEQIRANRTDIGPAADVWALGVILYELLTGSRPFRGNDGLAVIQRVICEPPLPLRRENRNLPRDLETICERCLEKDVKKRMPSAAELANELSRWLSGNSIRSRPTPRTVKLWRAANKNKPASLLLVLLAVVLIASGFWLRHKYNDAIEGREQAVAAVQQLDLVVSFLIETVRRAGPQNWEGGFLSSDDKGLAIVDDAALRVGPALEKDPVSQARVRSTIGRVYWLYGRFDKAEMELTEALRLQMLHLGHRHPDTIITQDRLATLYQDLGQLDESDKLFRQSLEGHIEVFGAEHLETLTIENNLAVLCKIRGELSESQQRFEKLLRVHLGKPTPEKTKIRIVQNNLGDVLVTRGRLSDGADVFRKALLECSKELRPDHPDIINLQINLAHVLILQDQLSEARQLLSHALPIAKRDWGMRHPRTLKGEGEWANLEDKCGNLSSAETAYRNVLVNRRSVGGPKNYSTMVAQHNLGEFLVRRGRALEAESLLDESFREKRKSLGADHLSTVSTEHVYATALAVLGKFEQAERLFRHAFATRNNERGPDDALTLLSESALGSTLYRMKNHDEAEHVLRHAYKGRLNKFGPHNAGTMHTRGYLAWLLYDTDRSPEAVNLFRENVHSERRWYRPFEMSLAVALADFATALLKVGKSPDAETALRESLVILTQRYPKSWQRFHVTSLLGESLFRNKSFDEAESFITTAYLELLILESTIPLQYRSRVTDAQGRIVEFYRAWGKPHELARWRDAPETLPKPRLVDN